MNLTHSSQSIQPQEEPAHEKSWLDLGMHVYVKTAMIAVLVWWIFREEIDSIVTRWVTDSSWSHGFLIPLFSLYFLNQKKEELLSIDQAKPSWLIGLPALLFLLVLYPLNIIQFKFAYGRPLIMIATLGAIVLFLGGWRVIRYTWLPVCYLFFAVPLPGRLYRQITIPMRELASQVATLLLNLIPELHAQASGVVIDVIYKGQPLEPSLDVAEACSGMRLLMAFLALGVAMAYLHERPIWQRAILLGTTIPIAVLCNVIRVTITGFIYILWDPKYAQGIYHDMLGMLMLPLAFCLYGGLAWLMNNLLVDEDEEAEKEDIVVRKKAEPQSEGESKA